MDYVAAVNNTTGELDYGGFLDGKYDVDPGRAANQLRRVYTGLTAPPDPRTQKDDGAGNLVAKTQPEIDAYDAAKKQLAAELIIDKVDGDVKIAIESVHDTYKAAGVVGAVTLGQIRTAFIAKKLAVKLIGPIALPALVTGGLLLNAASLVRIPAQVPLGGHEVVQVQVTDTVLLRAMRDLWAGCRARGVSPDRFRFLLNNLMTGYRSPDETAIRDAARRLVDSYQEVRS